MTGPRQTVLPATSPEAAMSTAEPDPLASLLEPELRMSMMPDADLEAPASGTPLAAVRAPVCALPGHEARAEAPPPAPDAQDAATPTPPQSGARTPSETGEEGAARPVRGSAAEGGEEAAAGEDAEAAADTARTRRAGRQRSGEGERREREEEEGPEPVEVPDHRLPTLTFIPVPPPLPLNLPGPLSPAPRPSAGVRPPREDDPDTRRRTETARAFADRRYEEVARRTVLDAQAHATAALSAARQVESEAAAAVRAVEAGAMALDMRIETAVGTAGAGIVAEAEARKLFVEERFRAAMSRLRAARRAAGGAINAGSRRAADHIRTICETHARVFSDEILYAIGDIEHAGSEALDSIERFRRQATGGTVFESHRRETPALNEIQKEVNEANGAGLADAMRGKVETRLYGGGPSPPQNAEATVELVSQDPMMSVDTSAGTTTPQGGFSRLRTRRAPPPNTSSGGVVGQLGGRYESDRETFEERLRPTLREQVETTGETLGETVRTTFRRTSRMLREQRDSAIAMIDRQAAEARAALAQQRRLARDTLKTQADGATEGIRGRAVSARGGLDQAVRGALPHQETALDRLRSTLGGTMMAPPEQIRRTAEIAADRVGASIAAASGAQRRQADVVRDRTLEGLGEDGARAARVREDFRTGQEESLAEADAAAREALARTATGTADAFPAAVEAMASAGASVPGQYAALTASMEETRTRDEEAELPRYAAGMDSTVSGFTGFADAYETPETEETTAKALQDRFTAESRRADTARESVASALGKIDATLVFSGSEEAELVGHLQGFTYGKGWHFRDTWIGPPLFTRLRNALNDNNYNAAYNYLHGRTALGAAYELDESRGVFNDDEARMERAMRALSPDQLAELDRAPADSAMGRMRDAARDVLGGTDRNVFDALRQGNYARADAYRFQEAQRRNLSSRNADNAHTTIRSYVGAAQAGQWGQNPTVTADQRRQMIANELANIRNPEGTPRTTNLSADEERANLRAMAEFATGTFTSVNPYRPDDGPRTTTTWQGANHDLARDLILHGENSREARAAQIGVEIERRSRRHHASFRPDIDNLDTALYDPRLNPNNYPPDMEVPERIERQALRERDEMLLLAYGRYGQERMSSVTDDPETAREGIIARLTDNLGHDQVATNLITGMVSEPVPSPRTASYAMQYATRGSGTKEPIIWRFVGRMSRDEIAEMRDFYEEDTDEDLFDRLGLYGRGAGELSGADRLRGERMFRGMARTDREKAEAAIYALRQQERETGGAGAALAEGTLSDRLMGERLRELQEIAGGQVSFDAEGNATWTGTSRFDRQGTFTGTANEQAAFARSVAGAHSAAEGYQAVIDHYAAQASMAIMAIGIIVAAAVTIATGGAAGPLLMAAIAGAAGLGGMAAKAAIRGGGYGWEEAAVDLGMTAVDMLTAGVGQALGLASRGGVAAVRQGMRAGLSVRAAQGLSRRLTAEAGEAIAGRALLTGRTLGPRAGQGALLTGSRLGDQAAIGLATGGLGGFGQTLLDERTYDERGRGAGWNLIVGTLSGMASGVATSTATFGTERLLGRTVAGRGRTLEELAGDPTFRGIVNRAGLEGLSAGVGAFVGTGASLSADAMRGRFRGDIGDAITKMGQEGLKNLAQGAFEGGGQGVRDRRQRLAEADRRTAAERGETPTEPSAPERPAQVDTEGTAAAIAGAVMRGDFLDAPEPPRRTIRAAEAIAADPPSAVGRVRAERGGDPSEARLVLGGGDSGEPATAVRVRQVDMGEGADVPVARFRREKVGDRYEYVVEVSGRAHDAVVGRALVHELAEIRVVERRRAASTGEAEPDTGAARDRLTPEAEAPPPDAGPEHLSPHDHGRLAELQHLRSALADPSLQGPQRTLLADEAQRLADHLGLVGGSPEAEARLALVGRIAGDLEPFVRTVAGEAADNPFLAPVEGTLENALGVFNQRLERARQLDAALGARPVEIGGERRNLAGFPLLADAVLADAARFAMDRGFMRIERLKSVDPTRRIEREMTAVFEGGLQAHVVLGAPHTRRLLDAIRARVADDAFRAVLTGEPIRARYADEPAPLKEAELDLDRTLAPHALDKANLSDLVTADAPVVRDLLDARDGLLDTRADLVARHETARGTARERIAADIDRINARLNRIAEVMGEVAARRVMEVRSEALEGPQRLTEELFPGSGAGLPDLVYRNPDGRPSLLIVEAKGGDSTLGTRRAVDGVRRAEQGTVEYLRSLAEEMTKPTKPAEVRALGDEIQRLLDTDPGAIEYSLVQQRLPRRGTALPPPEVGVFDLSGTAPSPVRGGGTAPVGRTPSGATGAADPVPGSPRFHGRAMDEAVAPRDAGILMRDAAEAIAERTEGVGSGVAGTQWPGAGELTRILVLRADAPAAGTPVIVKLRPAKDMGTDRFGRTRVAEYEDTDAGFVIHVSDRAHPDVYERALAHEIGEIKRLRRRGSTGERPRRPELLRRGETRAAIEDHIPQTSAHDEGRIAEMEILARDLADRPGDPALLEEAALLARHLGLDEDGPAADSRRQLVFDRLTESYVDPAVLVTRPAPDIMPQLELLRRLAPDLGLDRDASLTVIGLLAALETARLAAGPDLLRFPAFATVGADVDTLMRVLSLDPERLPFAEMVHEHAVDPAHMADLRNRILAAHGRPPSSPARDAAEVALYRIWAALRTVSADARRMGNLVYNMYSQADPERRHAFSTGARASFDDTIRSLRPEAAAMFRSQGPTAFANFFNPEHPVLYSAQLTRRHKVEHNSAGEIISYFDVESDDVAFHHFLRSQPPAGEVTDRVYLRVAADSAGRLIEDIVNDVLSDPHRFPGVHSAKIASGAPGQHGSRISYRNESMVIYLTDDPATMTNLRDYLAETERVDILLAGPEYQLPFADPFLSAAGRPLGSTAAQPPKGQGSFGQSRAGPVGEVLARGPWGDFRAFLEAVDEAWERAGIDPQNPHRQLRRSTP